MDITLAKRFAHLSRAQDAADIVRNCVHCGFCAATCPTYLLLGEESDSPRGRIYLIRELLEKGTASVKTRTHLDRCLLCRACETTCPSGVHYSRLLETGRDLLEQVQPRPGINTLRRKTVAKALVQTPLIDAVVKTGVRGRNLLPQSIRKQLPASLPDTPWPVARHQRKVLALSGCVQGALSPQTNLSAASLLDSIGISLLRESKAGCCGAVGLHTSDHAMGLQHARQRIDLWWPLVEEDIEAIVFTASGCGVTIKDYGFLLKDDPDYADRAARVSELAKDISQIVLENRAQLDQNIGQGRKIAFHPPCTLQHGLKLGGTVESILSSVGFDLLAVNNSHLCCGSAGTYSIFEPDISSQLRTNKLEALQQHQPEIIATANIGCQQHLKTGADVDVVHWIELLA
jgi:glycolate oxidase iron-sulfur subunit